MHLVASGGYNTSNHLIFCSLRSDLYTSDSGKELEQNYTLTKKSIKSHLSSTSTTVTR